MIIQLEDTDKRKIRKQKNLSLFDFWIGQKFIFRADTIFYKKGNTMHVFKDICGDHGVLKYNPKTKKYEKYNAKRKRK